MNSHPFFTLDHTDQATKARAGTIITDHGVIPTPMFMPVGTQGAVKAIEQRTLSELDAAIILGNTYHLYLRPGTETLKTMGGLHRFASWTRPILTDSGGFQVFSLRELRKMSEIGVEFRSHIDGSRHLFTPENVVDTQRAIGSDIFMVLDECTPYPSTYTEARTSMELTVRWAERSALRHRDAPFLYGHRQFQFAIGQGSTYHDLRRDCMQRLVDMDVDGYAIGGLSVGEPADDMYAITETSTAVMPVHKPRYLMGVGTPENILTAIGLGVDLFDCVMPTRNARNGTIYTTHGRVNIKNARYKLVDEPIDDGLDSYISRNYSLAYLRHLFNAGEILGLMLATAQNLALYLWLTRTARTHILAGTYKEWAAATAQRLMQHRP
ncbi:MAG: tRNA guanosine(34) transglycosylase Tgt [Candidatus Kapabacteria bacterium]|nr:tRNA guanosine(34) transglycosylase Tgt [Candidatus Kapabacteria bacterium]